MKLIVGLGNPGSEYERTRHNAGYLVVDRLRDRRAPGAVARGRFHALSFDLALRERASESRALLLKPTMYMNRSGLSVAEAVRFYKVQPAEDVLVIVDDVALPVGALRMRASGGAGGHNGLADVSEKLGTESYARLRIGVGSPGIIPQKDYVLGRFSAEQWETVQPVLDRAADAAETWAVRGVIDAMNTFNAPERPAPDAGSTTPPRIENPSAGAPDRADAEPSTEDPS